MDNYETEEQQVEAIKKWWNENFKMLIVLTIVGLGGIIGVQQWKQKQLVSSQTASIEYDHILYAIQSGSDTPIEQQVDIMLSEYADYPYAALAAMLEAKKMIADAKLAEAEKKYQWVVANTEAANLKHIARVRLASLMSAQGKNEQALQVLNVEPGSFKATYMETKGDILVALKRLDEARTAYDQALQAYTAIGANAQILKVKRNDLGNS